MAVKTAENNPTSNCLRPPFRYTLEGLRTEGLIEDVEANRGAEKLELQAGLEHAKKH